MVAPLSEEALREPVMMEWDELAWEGISPGRARVIHVSPDRKTIVILRLDGRSWPEPMPYAYAWSMVDCGAWSHVVGSPIVFSHPSTLTARQRALRDENWSVVGRLLQNHVPAIFDKPKRVALAAQAAAENRCTRRHVMNLLRRAFERGMSIDSVRSTLDGNGRYERRVTPGSKKLGRPVEIGDREGLNVDGEIRQYFANALRLFWAREKRINLKDAYDFCLRLYFMDLSGDILEGGTYSLKDRYAENGVPTYGQFRYWAPKVVDLESLRRRKLKPRVYDQRNRPILGNSNAATWGPGGRFQIDATVLDVYIRSRRSGKQLIGRPTLYVVIDVFSRMIVGIYVGLEAPSWIGAMMALANCVEDKVEFCSGFGVNIAPEDWPGGMIPAVLLGDRGEIEQAVAEHMISLARIKVETAAAYRGDWKGIVESCFRTLPAIFRPYVDGYVETDYRQRGVRDYRADAVLDLDDLTVILIELVLYHNNHHVMADYDRHPRLTEDEVPSIPRDLFNWGVSHLSGVPRRMDPEAFRFGLMPQADVTFTDAGAVFEGRHYDHPDLHGRFAEARRRGKVSHGRASYDKRRTDAILVHVRGGKGYVVARRVGRTSAAYGDSTAWEEHGARNIDRKVNRQAADAEIVARANAQGRVEAVNARAASRSRMAAGGSVKSQVANLRQNRADELALDRLRESEAFIPSGPSGSTSAHADGSPSDTGVVVPFGTPRASTAIPDFAARNAVVLEDDDD